MLIVKKDWTTQPQGPEAVDPKWGLISLWSAATPHVDLITGNLAIPTGGGATQSVSDFGEKVSTSGAARNLIQAPNGTNAYTVFALVKDSGASRGAVRHPVDSDGAVRVFQLRFDADNRARFIIFTSVTNYQTVSDLASSSTGLSLIVATVTENLIATVYLNGAPGSAPVTGAGVITKLTPATSLAIGNQLAGGPGYSGDIYLCGVANRAWSAEEIRRLSLALPDSAYELFAPKSSIILSLAANVTHDTSGALSGQGASIVGAATNFTVHQTTGALVGQGASIAGAATNSTVHQTIGVLIGAESSIVGSATNFTAHSTTGVLIGQGSGVAGVAANETGNVQFGGHYYEEWWRDKWRKQWEQKVPKLDEVVEFVESEIAKTQTSVKIVNKKRDIEYPRFNEQSYKLAELILESIIRRNMELEEEDVEILLLS